MHKTIDLYWYHEKPKTQQQHAEQHMQQQLNAALDDFLRHEQQQAYAIALVSVKQESDALDVVQETMLGFVSYYRSKPSEQWRPLFYRVLQNKINDHHRRKKGWLRYFMGSNDDHDATFEAASDQPSPAARLDTQQQGNLMIAIIKSLPEKQKQAIIYRHWQQMSVEETASIMQISTGSVKTHLHRATQKIKAQMGDEYAQTID